MMHKLHDNNYEWHIRIHNKIQKGLSKIKGWGELCFILLKNKISWIVTKTSSCIRYICQANEIVNINIRPDFGLCEKMAGHRLLNGIDSKDPLGNKILHEQVPFYT